MVPAIHTCCIWMNSPLRRKDTLVKIKLNDSNCVIEESPISACDYAMNGDAYRNAGNYPQAIYSFGKAIELDPDYAGWYFERGMCRCDTGQMEDGLSDLAKAIRLDPEAPMFYYHRGVFMEHAKRFHEAIDDFARAIALDDTDPAPYFKRGSCYRRMQQFAASIDDLKMADHIKPGDFNIINELGLACSAARRHEEAMDCFNRQISLFPDSHVGYMSRAMLYIQMRQYANVEADIRKALSLMPCNAQAHHLLGSLKLHEKDYEACMSHLQKAASLGHIRSLKLLMEVQGSLQALKEGRHTCDVFPILDPPGDCTPDNEGTRLQLKLTGGKL